MEISISLFYPLSTSIRVKRERERKKGNEVELTFFLIFDIFLEKWSVGIINNQKSKISTFLGF